jgi:hypothetical protein
MYLPFVEDEHTIFLKTIIPSRQATKQYLSGDRYISWTAPAASALRTSSAPRSYQSILARRSDGQQRCLTQATGTLGTAADYADPQLSPDGRRALVCRGGRRAEPESLDL